MTPPDVDLAASRVRGWRLVGTASPLLSTLFLLFGCTANPPDDQPQTELSPERQLLITSPDTGNVFFTRTGNAIVTPDSQVIVDAGDGGQLLVFDQGGRLLRTIGRRGQGPGEFRSVTSFGIRADSLWVFDYVARRVTTFSLATGRVASSLATSPSLPGWSGPIRIAALLEGGGMLVQGHSRLGDASGPSVIPFGVVSSSGRYTPIGTLDLAGTSFQLVQPNGTSIVGIQPFTPRPSLVPAPRGDRFALVEPGDTGVRITMFGSDGQVRYQTHLAIPGEELTRSIADSILNWRGPQVASAEGGAIHRPRRLPAVSVALADNDGSLWLRLDPLGLERRASRWLVVEPDGRQAGTVFVPSEHRVVRPDGSSYWAWVLDSLEVPSLGRYSWQAATR